MWSDGTPVTAEDVDFTAEYCMARRRRLPAGRELHRRRKRRGGRRATVKVNFSVAKPYPYGPFVGAQSPIIQKAQFENCVGARAPECTEANFGPIGTGPFVVTASRQ